jgi:membrane protease YdiL (CAAX protease family)
MENINAVTLNPRDKQYSEQLNPNNPSWNWGVSLLVWFSSIIFIGIAQGIFVIGYLLYSEIVTQNVSPEAAIAKFSNPEYLAEVLKSDTSAMFWMIASVIVAHLATFALAWLVVTRFNKDSFRDALGWNLKDFNVWNCIITVGVFYVIAFGLVSIFGEQQDEFSRILASSRAIVYAVAIMATFTAPIVEETVYRGLVYSAFYKQFGSVVAIIVATFLFAGVHFPQYWGNYAGLISLTLLSFAITLIRFKTNSVLPCIVLHTIFNASQSVLLLLQPWLESVATEEKTAFIHILK